jgi:hypothetical protein
MLDRLSETITNAGIRLERIEGKVPNPLLVFKDIATQQERDDAAAIVASFDWSDAAHLAWFNIKLRELAAVRLDTTDNQTRIFRALILVLIEEINSLRSWIRDFKTETDAATSLSDFKTRVASLPNLNDRTALQARAAITTKIQAGDAEE